MASVDSEVWDDGPVVFEKKNLADGEMDITPMIDIVFLLLIFFVVASKMTAEQAPKVPPAKNGIGIEISNSVLVTVKPGAVEVPAVEVGDGDNTRRLSNDPDQQSAEVTEYVSTEIGRGKQDVLLRADGGVPFGQIDRIQKAISEALEDGQMINLSVTRED